jgi:hypothetical protein
MLIVISIYKDEVCPLVCWKINVAGIMTGTGTEVVEI